MKKFYPRPLPNNVFSNGVSFFKRSLCILGVSSVLLLLSALPSYASHFRGGTVTWTRVSETSTTISIRLNVNLSWRVGSAPSTVGFRASGGNTASFSVQMTNSIDPSGGWTNSVGTAVITLNKTPVLTTLAFTGCCKISTLANNRDRSWNVFTVLNTAAGGSGPVSTMPAIINMPVGANPAVYNIPASDPDAGSSVTYRLATTQEMAGGTNPAGLAIDPTTGQLRFNTVGKLAGQQYNAMVVVTDNDGNQLLLDFMINMTAPSTPPAFDYSVTPADGFLYNVIAGQQISFPIRATDSDQSSFVDLSVSGLPAYITLANFSNAPLPARGNPAATTFTWTPSANEVNNTVILNFIATDNVGVQSSTSVTIRVSAEPPPVFSASTPGQGTVRQIITGAEHVDEIEASSPLGSNVSIGFTNGIPAGAILSPGIPTPAANPARVTLSWTPTPADFGQKNLSFQALIASTPTIFSTRSYSLIVNTPPAFSSSPTLEVDAGELFSYVVTVNDPDIPYGDQIDIIAKTLPSWLTLTPTSNGSALLSGTPAFEDGGLHAVHLEAEDTYHHGNPAPVAQLFNINVITCTDPVITCSADLVADTDAGKCSASLPFGAQVTGDPSPSMVYTIGDGQIISSPYDFPIGVTTITVTATNICKVTTCTFNVTVNDNEKPVIIASPDVNKTSDEGKCSALVSVSASATDNCSALGAVGVRSDGAPLEAPYPVGTTTIEWNAVDANGNAAEPVIQTVQVTDSEVPVITHSGDVQAVNDNGQCGAVVTLGASVTDNCSALGAVGVRSDGAPLEAPYPVGTTTIEWNAVDANGNAAEPVIQTVQVTDSEVPVITHSGDVQAVNDNGQCGAVVTVGASVTDNCSALGAVGVRNDGAPLEAPYPVGTTTIEWNAVDANGNAAEPVIQTVQVTDSEAPVITHSGNIQAVNDIGVCSATVSVVATTTDNCGVPSATGVRSDGLALDAPFPVGTTTVVWSVTDIHGNPADEVSQTVTVNNAAPVITNVVPSIAVVSINAPVTLTVDFSDTNVTATRVDWGDQSYDDIVPGDANSISAIHMFATPGVYSITATVTDACGLAAEYVYRYLVAYDPNGGFVTGGGWIHSPAGAYTAAPALEGKANFGFVAKYKKGTTIPDGNTEFQFHAGNFKFNSTSYEWLVVAGHKAQYKGLGTINGSGSYSFMITGIDGNRGDTTGPDKFRLKIMDGSTVVYDNKIGAPDDADDATALGGGSIVIHDGNSKSNASARMAGGVQSHNDNEEVASVVFPNPVQDVIHFTYSSKNKAPLAAQLVDLQGKGVKQQVYDVSADSQYTMDIGDLRLKSGFYLLSVRQGASVKFLRVIKQ